jgi:hypothetical protein
VTAFSPAVTHAYVRRRGRTRFTALRIRELPADATVLVTCKTKKKGCHFARKTVSHSGGTLNLRRLVKKLKLAKGAVLKVRITAADRRLKLARYAVTRRGVRVTYRCGTVGAPLRACR